MDVCGFLWKQDNVHMNTESVQCISTVYSIYVRINVISELFRPVEKKQFNFKLYSSNDPFSFFCIILTEQ